MLAKLASTWPRDHYCCSGTTLILADNMERVLPISMPTTETAALNVENECFHPSQHSIAGGDRSTAGLSHLRTSSLRPMVNLADNHRAARAECQRGSPSARFRNTVEIVQGPPPAKAK